MRFSPARPPNALWGILQPCCNLCATCSIILYFYDASPIRSLEGNTKMGFLRPCFHSATQRYILCHKRKNNKNESWSPQIPRHNFANRQASARRVVYLTHPRPPLGTTRNYLRTYVLVYCCALSLFTPPPITAALLSHSPFGFCARPTIVPKQTQNFWMHARRKSIVCNIFYREQALEATLPFDQRAILEENMAYIRDSLALENVEVLDAAGEEGDAKRKASAEPGRPTLFLF